MGSRQEPLSVLGECCRRVYLDETPEQFWLRLNEEAVRRQTALQAIDNVQAAQYTFKPAINSRSRQVRLVRAVTIAHLMLPPCAKRPICLTPLAPDSVFHCVDEQVFAFVPSHLPGCSKCSTRGVLQHFRACCTCYHAIGDPVRAASPDIDFDRGAPQLFTFTFTCVRMMTPLTRDCVATAAHTSSETLLWRPPDSHAAPVQRDTGCYGNRYANANCTALHALTFTTANVMRF